MGLIARGDRVVTVQARTPVAPGAGFDIVVPVELSRIRRQLTIQVIEPSRARTSHYQRQEVLWEVTFIFTGTRLRLGPPRWWPGRGLEQ